MKTFLFAAVLAWASLAAQGQAYYLNLRNERLDVPNRAVAVERVVDGRDGHPAIGLVYRGLGNKPAAVLFQQGMEAELTAFVQAQLPARPTDHPAVLCLRQLRVGEVMNAFSERASADLAADVYVHLPDGYHFVQSVGARTSARNLDATGRHAGHLALLLGQCLGQLEHADWAAAAAQPARALAQLATDVPGPLAGSRRGPGPPILSEVPRRGVYHGFEQFLANRPDTLAFRLDTVKHHFLKSSLAKEKWLGVAWVRPLAPNGQDHPAVPPGAWGFSDGQQLFVLHDKQFFPLARQGSFFTFVGEAPRDVEYDRAANDAYARSRLVGVATVRAVDHTGEPMAYSVDMRTGELAPYPGLRAPTRLDTAYVYVYRPAQAASPGPVSVFLNGRAAGHLRPGEYLELPWPYYAKPVQLCLGNGTAANSCQYFVPNAAGPNYLKINPAGTPGTWQWVSERQGAADLDELDKRRK